MRAKSVPRRREWQSAGDYPVMKHPQRTVRIDRQNDDVRLHELLRGLEGQLDRGGISCYWLQLRLHFVDGHRRRNGPGARRSRESYVRWPVPRQLRVVALIYRPNARGEIGRQLRQDEYSVQLQSSLSLRAPVNTKTERRTEPG